MTLAAAPRGPCVMCGSRVRIEANHVAARANDRTLTVLTCKRCHDVFTDWQWRLGILRRETVAARSAHTELERVWSLVEGFVLTACLGGATRAGLPAVPLGRATGTLLAIASDAIGEDRAWGPRPAMRRGTDEAAPEARGTVGLADLLRLAVAVCARLGDADGRLGRIGADAEAIAERAAAIDGHGALICAPDLGATIARALATFGTIAQAESLDDVVAHGDEIAELAAFADRMLDILSALGAAESTESAIALVGSMVEATR